MARVSWSGQSAFHIGAREGTVVIDPFSDVEPLRAFGFTWGYPPIEPVAADVLPITHEHPDHNEADVVTGDPQVVRSTAGTFETPIGPMTAIAGEHDPVAGTLRAQLHLRVRDRRHPSLPRGRLRPVRAARGAEKRDRSGRPALRGGRRRRVAGRPTGRRAGADPAPRWVVPMHYRTPAINFLEPVDGFLIAMRESEVLHVRARSSRPTGCPRATAA